MVDGRGDRCWLATDNNNAATVAKEPRISAGTEAFVVNLVSKIRKTSNTSWATSNAVSVAYEVVLVSLCHK